MKQKLSTGLSDIFSGVLAQALIGYMEKNSTPPSKERRALHKATLKQKGIDADMQSGHLIGWLLHFLVLISGARRILEIGRFTGGSALAMAEALEERGGKIVSLDIDAGISYDIALKFWRKAKVLDLIDSRIGDALKIVPQLKGWFDLAFIDGDKTQYSKYWNAVLPNMRKGGIIIVDDALREGRILNPKRKDDKAVARFIRMARQDKRVKMFLLPIGDGILFAVKQ